MDLARRRYLHAAGAAALAQRPADRTRARARVPSSDRVTSLPGVRRPATSSRSDPDRPPRPLRYRTSPCTSPASFRRSSAIQTTQPDWLESWGTERRDVLEPLTPSLAARRHRYAS